MSVIFDNASARTRGLNVSSLTTSHTCNGTDRFLYVTVVINASGQPALLPTSVTYNGVALTYINTGGVDVSGRKCATYYLINPTTGTNNIVTTFASSQTFVVYSASYINVKQTSPIINSGVITSFTGTSITATPSTLLNGYAIMSGTWSNGSPSAITNCVMRQVEVEYIGSWQVDNIFPSAGTSNIGFTGPSQNLTGVYISLESAPLSVIAHYKLDESSGNAIDSSGNGYTLTNSNVTYGAGKLGNGALFDSDTKYFSRSYSSGIPSGSSARAYSFWVKPTTGNGVMLSTGNLASLQRFSILLFNNNIIRINVGGAYVDVSIPVLSTSTWSYITISYEAGASVAKVYVNSILISTANLGYVLATSTSGMIEVGKDVQGATASFSGSLDEITIFPFALTADEVSYLYNGGAGRPYPFTSTTLGYPMINLLGQGQIW